MKKIKHFILSALPVLIALVIAYFGYNYLPTTPVLILVLLVLFISLIWSIGLFRKDQTVAKKLAEIRSPELEEGLIYIIPQDFADKSESKEGKLFLAGSPFDNAPFTYSHASYKKLTDELTISFQPKLDLVVHGIKTIGIGDYQFCLFGFSKMEVIQSKGPNLVYQWNDDYLSITSKSEEKFITLEDGSATLIFEWDNSIIDE